ncbi:ABC transporter substrate-binding protein [Candidatus Parcubacteria bacterium]|nr:ABC transporter substrate-binding protein [Candidatus Parcubacteria bacterium]
MLTRTKIGIIGVFALLIIFVGFLSFNKNDKNLSSVSTETKTVKIGYLPISANLHLFAALKEGYFEHEGVSVEAIKFQNPNVAMDAVLSGQIDGMGVAGYGLIFPPYSKDTTQLKTFLSLEENEDNYNMRLLVLKDSDIKEVKDLEGKKIGTYVGLPLLINAKLLMKELGLENKVEYIQVKTALQNDAFVSGQFDALLSIEPYPTIALNNDIARILVDKPRIKYLSNPYPAAAAVFSTKFLQESPELAKKVIRAYESAIELMRKDSVRARLSLVDFTPLKPAIAQETLLYHWRKVDEVEKDVIQKNADMFFEAGLLKNKINVDNLIGDWNDVNGK